MEPIDRGPTTCRWDCYTWNWVESIRDGCLACVPKDYQLIEEKIFIGNYISPFLFEVCASHQKHTLKINRYVVIHPGPDLHAIFAVCATGERQGFGTSRARWWVYVPDIGCLSRSGLVSFTMACQWMSTKSNCNYHTHAELLSGEKIFNWIKKKKSKDQQYLKQINI